MRKSYKYNLKYLTIIIVVCFLAFTWAFSFNFLIDDWYQILGGLYYPELFKTYINLHPVSILEFSVLSRFLRFNPYYWQFLDFTLRVFSALSLSLLMWALTNSKKSAFYSALVFASFIGGIETYAWTSANSSAFAIILICIAVYYWVKSEDKKILYPWSILFLFLSFMAEPARAAMVLVIFLIWDLFSFYQKRSKLFWYLIRNIISILTIFLSSLLAQKFYNIKPDFLAQINQISFKGILGFIYSLNNILVGWIKIPNSPSKSLFSETGIYWPSIIFLSTVIILFGFFLFKKSDKYKILIILLLWIPLFYFPNWFSQNTTLNGMVLPAESRYFAISSLGFAGVIGYLFSRMRRNGVVFLSLFVILNIIFTNISLKYIWSYRSVSVHSKLWNQIDNDVPKDEQNSIFMFLGEDYIRAVALDWADTIPFAVKRGITKKEDYPIYTNDKKLIIKLVCEGDTERTSPFGPIFQKEKIPLSHLHAWNISKGVFTNRSDIERNGIIEKIKSSNISCPGIS